MVCGGEEHYQNILYENIKNCFIRSSPSLIPSISISTLLISPFYPPNFMCSFKKVFNSLSPFGDASMGLGIGSSVHG